MRKVAQAIKQVLREPGEKVRLFVYWFLVLSFLVLIPNIGFILEVLFNQTFLPWSERFNYVSSLYTNTFRFILEPVMLSLVILSFVLALNFLVIKFVRQRNRAVGGRYGGTVAMLVSSHCVACGGSLLAPLAGLFTGAGAYFSNDRYLKLQLLTVTLNLIAIAIAYRSMRKAAGSVLTLAQRFDNTPRGY
jgi:uncharacterized membrane protein